MNRFVTLAAALAPAVLAQTYTNTYGVYTITQDTGADVALASKSFEWPDLPYQADTGDGSRGTQQGYNLCNASTQSQESWCQTAYINAVDDFCLWGSPITNETVADTEEEMVAYCTKPKYGTRLIPEGAIQGIQFIRTPDYVEIVGYIDQTGLNLQADDSGGEEDPHGDDERGNPLGSLLYSSAFNANDSTTSNYTQVHEWSYFVGSGVFCFKACDPAGSRAAELCQHTYDRVGCAYNDPASYSAINGTFQSCKGADQLPVGEYVTGGVTTTWTQPAESLGVISTIPYTASIPATSDCSTYTSASIFTEVLGASSTAAASTTASSSGSKATGSSSKTSTSAGSAATASSTGSSEAATTSSSSTSAAEARFAVGAMVTVGLAALVSASMALLA